MDQVHRFRQDLGARLQVAHSMFLAMLGSLGTRVARG